MIRACLNCGAKNRVPAQHLADTGRCGACKQALPPLAEPVDVDTAAFNEIVNAARVPVLVDFWASWCQPCKMAAPEVKKAAQQLAGKALVLKVSTEDNPELANQYAVRSIPMFAVFNNGELRWQQSGVLPGAQLVQATLAQI